MGVRVLRFDGAFAPRGLKFDTACGHEGCGGRLRRHYYKTFTTGLRPRENMQTALWAKEKRPPLVAGATTFPPQLHWWDYGRYASCHMSLWGNIERPILPPE